MAVPSSVVYTLARILERKEQLPAATDAVADQISQLPTVTTHEEVILYLRQLRQELIYAELRYIQECIPPELQEEISEKAAQIESMIQKSETFIKE